ncbi:MAG: cysteine--tRNA ligase [Candidatus Aureabacteria bacterium]|nr:cysteine--tRNA ligase [Candidatus Auribacterota bacterium]
MQQESKLKVYNTATRRVEEFHSLKPREVGMYVCGPTVYDDCHMGHARMMVAFEVVIRWLEYRGFKVKYVLNITDIDDKIIKRAAERGMPCSELAEHYLEEFHKDMDRLALRNPTVEPRATAHIQEMIKLISALWEKGFAYEANGDVYYDVSRFPNYGKLSRRNTDELLAGARVEINERKKNPLDFVLWKSAKPGEPQWPSPWGPGRPGWHIECSTMSTKYLGKTFDIHGGGQDLIFPHHENEIAQSEGATGNPLACYWLHNALVMVDETKMSKSLGNFFTLKEVFQKYDPHVVRYFLLSKHYRTPIDFSESSLSEARVSLRRLDECVARAQEAVGGVIEPAAACPERFVAAMDEDFNTTEALGVVFNLVSRAHVELDGRGTGWAESARRIAADIRKCCEVLGIPLVTGEAVRVTAAEEAFDREGIERLLGRESLSQAEVEKLLKARNALRARKEFSLADRIRLRVQAMGYEVRDDKGKGSMARKGMKRKV